MINWTFQQHKTIKILKYTLTPTALPEFPSNPSSLIVQSLKLLGWPNIILYYIGLLFWLVYYWMFCIYAAALSFGVFGKKKILFFKVFGLDQ